MSENTNQITEEMNAFYERADEFIQLANTLRTDDIHAGKINASMLYAVARLAHGQPPLALLKALIMPKKSKILSNISPRILSVCCRIISMIMPKTSKNICKSAINCSPTTRAFH